MSPVLRKKLLAAIVSMPTFFGLAAAANAPSLDAAFRDLPNFTREQRQAIYRAEQERMHPQWRDLSLSGKFERVARFLRAAFAAPATASGPSPANFQGNLTAIQGASGETILMRRQADCSLTLYSGSLVRSANATAQSLGSATNYQNVLHAAAGLTTRSGVYAGGCAEPTTGLSSRVTAYLGKTAQGLDFYASTGADFVTGNEALYFGALDPTSQTVYHFTTDESMPDIGSIAVGDLNGDGIADIIGVDAASASISVWIAQANGTIASPVHYALTGTNAEAAVVADVNGDGKADVVVATLDSTTGQETISVLTGKGDGTLNAPQTLPVSTPAAGPTSGVTNIVNLIAADLRGAGRMDLVASNGLVLLNNGAGTFTPGAAAFAPKLATSQAGPNLVAADFNNDGKLDLAVDNGTTVSIYPGAGDGTFTLGKSFASNTEVGYLAASDLDGDGNVDLFIGQANGGAFGGDTFDATQAYALMGNGDGTFRGAPYLPFVVTGSNIADLNGDGHADAIGVNANGSLTVYLGDGKGNFNAASTLATSPVSIGGTQYTVGGIDSLAIGDINGDGIADLAYIATGFNGPGGTPGVFIALGNGQGGFAAPTYYPVPSPLSAGNDYAWAISNLRLADFNRDGKADLIYNFVDTSSFSGANPPPSVTYLGNAVQLGNGNGTFQAPQLIPYRSAPYAQFAPVETSYVQLITDLNRDGIPDLVFLSQGSSIDQTLSTYTSTIQVALGKGDGTFGTPSTVAGPPIMVQSFTDVIPASLAVADMNGDGIPDLIAVGTDSSTYNLQIAVALGKGDGTFGAPSISATAGQYLNNDQQLAVGDFNGDGKLDVAILDPYVTSASGIYLGNGDGTLQYSGSASAAQPVLAIYLPVGGASIAADFNGDGKADILSASTLLLSQAAVAGLPDFTIGLSAAGGTVSAGSAAQATVTLTPDNGFNGNVALSCSGLPAGAACSFAPATVPVSGSAGSSKLTITTSAGSASAAAGIGAGTGPAQGSGSLFLAALGLPLLLVRRHHLRSGRRLGLVLLLLSGSLLASSCGGGGGGSGGGGGGSMLGGTPAGSYTITISASGASSTHNASYALTVN
jgi:hypothetical protein